MIIDVHTHVLDLDAHCGRQVLDDLRRCGMDAGAPNPDASGSGAPTRWRFRPEDHLRATAAADVAIVFGLQAAATGWNVPNEFVAEHVRRAPGRLVFFASIDPGREGFLGELEHCHRDLGCRGVKLGPIYQGVHPLDKRYYEIHRYCQRHGLPVLIHMATTFSHGVPLDFARPAHMDQVAVDFPDLKIVMPHLGHPWEGEAIAAIRHQPNLFADLSALYCRPWQFYNSMRLLVEYGAAHKVLFGSDYPATTTADSLAGVRNVNAVLGASGLPAVPADLIEQIIHRDSLGLLGLERPAATGGL